MEYVVNVILFTPDLAGNYSLKVFQNDSGTGFISVPSLVSPGIDQIREAKS